MWRGSFQNFIRYFAQFNLAYFFSSYIYESQSKNQTYNSYLIYLGSGLISNLLVYPLDIVKNKYLVSMRDKYSDKPYKSIPNCMR